ncbi:MAG: hypothetical protein HC878_03625 [Leptolyngbyaceae cyanobacterium SL_5_14]|nr:hypothetical protein [Leptolyngbyaceae cyanobacterium SL_5_14]
MEENSDPPSGSLETNSDRMEEIVIRVASPPGEQADATRSEPFVLRPVIAATLRPTLRIPPLRYGRGRLGASLR